MVEALFEQYPERKTDWPTQNMLGRLSKPREYRGAAVFLLSDASSFMVSFDVVLMVMSWEWLRLRWITANDVQTGADLKMDGGHSAW